MVLRSLGWRTFLVAALAATLLLFAPTNAQAQVGLGDVLETQNIRSDLESGRTGRNRKKPAATSPAPEESVADEVAGEAAAPTKSTVRADKWNDQHSILRMKKPAAAWPKLLVIVGLFLVWVRTADWINRDSHFFKLGHELWNPVTVFPFVLAFLISPLIPNFAVAASLMGLAWLVPFGIYVAKHNSSVEAHEKIFTSDWFRFQIASGLKAVGFKVSAEKKADYMHMIFRDSESSP